MTVLKDIKCLDSLVPRQEKLCCRQHVVLEGGVMSEICMTLYLEGSRNIYDVVAEIPDVFTCHVCSEKDF